MASSRAPAQAPPGGDARLRAQQAELDRIRRERNDLQRRMADLQHSAHDLSEEVANLDRQADATAHLVKTLDTQLAAIGDEVTATTANLVRAQDELVVKRAILQRRVRDIYKRGPLNTTEALLSAQTFGELVARYKWLHLLALRDRALVRRVEELKNQIGGQRELVVRLQASVEENRTEKAQEEARLRALEQQRQQSLADTRRKTKQTQSRLQLIARDEARVANMIASIEEAARREAARRRAAAVAGASPAPERGSSLKGADLGALAWPIEGSLLFRFGRVVNRQSNTTTRWNGLGIAAPAGTPVKAVSSGVVEFATKIGTYGLVVLINHGGSDFTLYGSLGSAAVKEKQPVGRGQVIGTVGTSDPELPPHLYFEIRPNARAVDPEQWLKPRPR